MDRSSEHIVCTPAPTVALSACGGPAARQAVSWRRWLALGPLAAVLLVAAWAGWYHVVTIETVANLHERFHDAIDTHLAAAVLIYVLAYTAIVSLSLPSGGLMTLTGGLLFGWLIGGVAAIVAATLGASILFGLTRCAAGDRVAARFGPQIAKFQDGFRRDAMNYMLFLRFVPLFPFCVVNVVPALLGVPFRTFFFGTLVGILPATLAVSTAGAGLDDVLMTARAQQAACHAANALAHCPLSIHIGSLITPQLKIAGILLSLLALVPVAVKYWRHRDGR